MLSSAISRCSTRTKVHDLVIVAGCTNTSPRSVLHRELLTSRRECRFSCCRGCLPPNIPAGDFFDQALIYYDFCFPDEDSQQQELDGIRHACLLNSAACFLACGELGQTLDCCYQASSRRACCTKYTATTIVTMVEHILASSSVFKSRHCQCVGADGTGPCGTGQYSQGTVGK